ncbi:hypothetical protein [Paeniglutamicibacter psychrophenolicus]|uniref:Uncharacterized protein n=1 Tax=Paeniglutamicibacter psychrophenolicus TaxID=257454 RepID=A0ABS4WFG2_9MICC|nr:hypothetical protein [Paeniglutamicibacter psychrophenolicus]MBP2374938.1 hypothetical protein [Paeniglutamicibacter psychrophenolicus]
MGIRTWGTRAAAATGAVALASVVAAPAALAHECFKKQWSDAAYAQQLQQKRWMPLDVLAEQFIIAEVAPDCVGKIDLVPYMEPWMEAEGISHVPLIYMNSSISEKSFAAWANESGNSGPGLIGSGQESRAIGYIGNHIDALDQLLGQALGDAVSSGVCEFPG